MMEKFNLIFYDTFKEAGFDLMRFQEIKLFYFFSQSSCGKMGNTKEVLRKRKEN